MSENQNNNPYAVQVIEPVTTANVQIESSRAIAEVQGQVMMAKKFPRDPLRSVERILGECRRPTLAEQAQYSYPKGGQMVTGPSIRLAETIARNWGNMSYGTKEIERVGDESSMQAYAWDMETNVISVHEFKVKHTRDTRNGRVGVRDERDIYELTANYAARRLRSCILKVIPADVVEGAERECQETLQATLGDVKEKLPAMLKTFEEMGVTKQMIEKRLRHRIDSINGPELLNLRKIYLSIKDEMSVVEDYFELPDVTPKAESSGVAGVKAAMLKPKAKPTTPPPAPKEPAPKEPTPKEPAPKEPTPKEPAPKEPEPKDDDDGVTLDMIF